MSGTNLYLFNYVDFDILANSDVSSEQASFPVANAYNANRRSKVWRSNGYFKVESTNNQIVFRETSGGPDLTASITAGEYTSITAMCTAIKTALEAVGDSTYTVTNSSSTGYRFQIVSNGAGGTGVFHLMLTSGSFTCDELLGFDDSVDLTDAALTRVSDFLRINSQEFILWDMGLVTNPKAFILVGPRNSPLKISPSATIKLQASYADSWASPPFETTLTYADNCIFMHNETGLADTAYRYWRLQIEDQNPNGYIEVGAFFLGNHFMPARGCVQFPLPSTQIDTSEQSVSEGGQSFSDIQQTTASYQLRFFGLQKADIEEFEERYVEYGQSKPFFIALDSNAAFSSVSSKRVVMVKIVGDPTWSLISPDNFELNLTVQESL